MARIAFVLLCHKDPDGIIRQAERLTAAGDCMAIHFDARARAEDYERIRRALAGNPNVTFARRRVRCGWGEWSLVQATLEAVRAALAAFPDATHLYMLSGDCMAIKPAEYVHAFLDGADVDYIESFDFFTSGWIKTGMREERLIYRHPFNERTQKSLFYGFFNLQKRLGLTRAIPADIQVMIGSQWWCLRRRTVEWVLDFCDRRPEVVRFFRTTWIPDETFFQTIVRQVVPDREIQTRSLTFLMFSDYGMPVTFYNDHYDLLLSQDYLFARKISPEARDLKRRLGDLYAAQEVTFNVSNEGRRLYGFLTGRGREGRRFARRVWEREASVGRDRELLIIVCKKWHVAKRLADLAATATGVPAVHYLFNEEPANLPDLGGIELRVEKRNRHRRTLVRMLYERFGTERLILCMDPADFVILEDFSSDRATVRILEIVCDFSDEYLVGHAQRIGLAGEATPPETLARLLPTIRADIAHESERLRDAGLAHFHRIRESAAAAENAMPLAAFLSVPVEMACGIAGAENLFSD